MTVGASRTNGFLFESHDDRDAGGSLQQVAGSSRAPRQDVIEVVESLMDRRRISVSATVSATVGGEDEQTV